MAKVINIIGSCSNVGKTTLVEGIIKELKLRNYKVATIKHDVHGFDIDKKGKDTYRHREAGAETVVISSKNRFAMIKEMDEEMELFDIVRMVSEKDIILVEGYKNSNLRKIEVFRDGVSKKIITPHKKLIAIASNIDFKYHNVPIVNKEDYVGLVNLIIEEEEYELF